MHRHHPSSELRNRAISHLPRAGGDRELFLQREQTIPKAGSKLAVAPSTPTSEHLQKLQRQLHNSTIPMTSLPVDSTATVPDNGGPKKIAAEAILVDKMVSTIQNSEVGESASQAKSFILRNVPQCRRCDGLAKLRMLIVLTISLPQHPSQEDQFRTSRILISRLRADSGNPNKKLQKQVTTAGGKAQSEKRTLTGRQVVMIHEFFSK